MKFCVDCKHVLNINRESLSSNFAVSGCYLPVECKAIAKESFDEITGRPVMEYASCSHARAFYGKCGVEALLYEEIEECQE